VAQDCVAPEALLASTGEAAAQFPIGWPLFCPFSQKMNNKIACIHLSASILALKLSRESCKLVSTCSFNLLEAVQQA
jgi:hypothetical protein